MDSAEPMDTCAYRETGGYLPSVWGTFHMGAGQGAFLEVISGDMDNKDGGTPDPLKARSRKDAWRPWGNASWDALTGT